MAAYGITCLVMRIGIVSEYSRPWPGGISEHVHHEAEELGRRGHHVTILTGPGASDGRCSAELWRLGHALEVTDNGARSRVSYGRELWRLGRRLSERAFDVLHVHAPLDPVLCLASVLAAPCPVVGTFHASFAPALGWQLRYRAFGPLRRAFARLRVAVAVSPEARRSIAHYYPADYRVIPNGVDVTRFRPDVAVDARHASAQPTVLFVGRADPRKGLALLLAAFERVRREVEGARLLLAGVSALELAALSAPSAQVSALGYVTPGELPALYAAADVVCAPSRGQESQGIVLLEAMASGKPALCFDIPGYRDTVRHGIDAWVVGEASASGLAAGLTQLLHDAELRRALGRAARTRALEFGWPIVAGAIEQALFDALQQG
jgi:phosphatidylinositol alpha-mannosyltransferase